MRNLKKHIIMVSAAAMFAAAGFAGNSVFAAEPTTDNFVLPPQMTEQQKADWAKDNPQYREKETQQAERTARMAPKAVTPDEVTNTGRDYRIALLNAEEGRAPRSDENAMMQKDGQPAPSDKANGPRVRREVTAACLKASSSHSTASTARMDRRTNGKLTARRASSISKAKNVMESTASTDRTVTDSTAKVRKTSVSNTIRTRALISKKVMSRASIRRTTNSVRETASPPLLRTQVSSRVRTDRCSLKNKDCLT